MVRSDPISIQQLILLLVTRVFPTDGPTDGSGCHVCGPCVTNSRLQQLDNGVDYGDLEIQPVEGIDDFDLVGWTLANRWEKRTSAELMRCLTALVGRRESADRHVSEPQVASYGVSIDAIQTERTMLSRCNNLASIFVWFFYFLRQMPVIKSRFWWFGHSICVSWLNLWRPDWWKWWLFFSPFLTPTDVAVKCSDFDFAANV